MLSEKIICCKEDRDMGDFYFDVFNIFVPYIIFILDYPRMRPKINFIWKLSIMPSNNEMFKFTKHDSTLLLFLYKPFLLFVYKTIINNQIAII